MAAIVHICPRYAPARGGVESYFTRLSDALVARGDHVSVWTTDAPTVRALTSPPVTRTTCRLEMQNGTRVVRFPVRYLPAHRVLRTAAHVLPFGLRWRTDTLRWTPWLPAMTRAAGTTRERVDLVHVGPLPYSSLIFAGVRLAEHTGARLVVSPFTHIPAPGPAGRLMRRAYLSPLNVSLLARADRLCAQTAIEEQALVEAGLPAERIVRSGVGVDPEDVAGGHRERARSGWRVAPDAVVIGQLGNKSWDKGTVDLLAASERAWTGGARFSLVLAGPDMPGFAARLSACPFRDRIINASDLSDDDRRDWFAGIDVFAMPSYVESFGISALEAASCGVPVIAYAHGGPAEIFTDGENARLVAPGNVEALAAAVSALAADACARAALGAAGRTLAARYPWTDALTRSLAVYDDLLRGVHYN